MENKERDTHVICDESLLGEVKIADEVLAVIAGIAATEVEGVDSMVGGWRGEIISRLGVKNLSKGVRLAVDGKQLSVDLTLNIKYGYSIPEVSAKVQDKVSQTLESMTELEVTDINIKIAGVVTNE